jgi:hypothetical protein
MMGYKMAILSFALTTEAFLSGKKTKTRRRFSNRQFTMWCNQFDKYPDKIHTAVDKVLYAGGKRIGGFKLTAMPRLERLGYMPEEDLESEGGMWSTVEEFIKFINGTPDEVVTVISFTKTEV